MYSKAKYVVGEILTRDIMGSIFGAIVFSECSPHRAIVNMFAPGSIVGAGFFHADETAVYVYGESTGLGVKSRPEDIKHVARAIAHASAVT
jgi:hypothetical protein